MSGPIRFKPGDGLSARRLNTVVDPLNELLADAAPRQKRSPPEGPLITDDVTTEGTPQIETWDEVFRGTETVRVTNPEDSEQYVDVERVTGITFRRPDGVLVLLRLDND